MEFWGTEVAPSKPQVNSPGEKTYCHVSQAALGPSKDGKSERVVIRVETGGKNVVLGTLVSGKVDQMALDLIFDREFKLSHTSTSSSVFFCGYKTEMGGEEDYTSDEESDEGEEKEDGEDVPTLVPINENGTAPVKEGGKAGKKLAKVIDQVAEAKPKKADPLRTGLIDHEALEDSSEEDDEDEDEDEDDDEEAEGAMHSNVKMDFDSDDEEDDSEFEVDDDEIDSDEESDEVDEEDSDEDDEADDEEEDVAAEFGKKRALISSSQKSPVGGKKPRLDTPAKPGSQTAAEYWESLIIAGRKGLITTPGKKAKGASDTKLTPVTSAKKSGAKGAVTKTPQKTPAKEAVTPKTPKTSTPSGDSAKKLGSHSCGTCNKSFTTESGLSQHNAAKHKN